MTCICGRRGLANVQLQSILNLGARRDRCLAIRSGRFVTRKDLVYIWVNENGKYLTPVGIQSPDCPVYIQPLCVK